MYRKDVHGDGPPEADKRSVRVPSCKLTVRHGKSTIFDGIYQERCRDFHGRAVSLPEGNKDSTFSLLKISWEPKGTMKTLLVWFPKNKAGLMKRPYSGGVFFESGPPWGGGF